MRQWSPGGHQVVIPDAGHTVALTHPQIVAGALAAFLRLHPMPRTEE